MVKEYIPKNVEADDLINQAKGLRAVKERKREERIRLNLHKHLSRRMNLLLKDTNRPTKRQKVSDQIQRGFNIATKWRNENVDKSIE
jgi:hypothetical protein